MFTWSLILLAVPDLINQISNPFDFQHLSHTDRHQFAALDNAPNDKFAAALWDTRASKNFGQGHANTKPEYLHFRNFSTENLATSEDRATSALSFRSPPRSPEAHQDAYRPDTNPRSGPARQTLRLARSVESFSQPGVSPRKQHYSPPAIPSHLPSRGVLSPLHNDLDGAYGEEVPLTRRTSRSKRESGVWDSFVLSATTTPDQLPGIQEDASYFGHALTTPDDSAIHAMTPPFSPSLADVAEEPERFVSPRPAPQPPARAPTTPMSPYFEGFSSSSQRSPVARSRVRGMSQSSPHNSSQRSSITRPTSQMSDTLGSTNFVRRGSEKKSPATRRRSNTWRAIEESWEDDVDYIYENALEADCDLDWDRMSAHKTHQEERSTREPTQLTIPQGHQAQASERTIETTTEDQFFSTSFRTSLLVPSTSSLPELIPTSAVSASTTSTGLPTPCETFNTDRFHADESFALTPSLLIPQEYKDHHEVTYEDLLDEYDGSDRHFPMLDTSQSVTSSARSSRVRLSRRSSYDSSLMSSVQSSGLWSSPIRRSASSAGSVPDLVPSRRTRKDLGFSLVIDDLSEHAAALNYFDESKEDDITPPGRALEGRTFFSSEDEIQETEKSHEFAQHELRTSLEVARRGSQRTKSSALEDELRASLDLARRGSQRSTRSHLRQHKPALSDSAAKLLSSSSATSEDTSIKPRTRAATTTQTRQPMLSLFPTPPRYPNRT